MQEGRIERRSPDCYRHGTATLFAALDIATGQVTAALKPRHRHQEFLAFLKQVERTYRDVVDEAVAPVERHLRIIVHFTPTHPHGQRPGELREHCLRQGPDLSAIRLLTRRTVEV